MVMGLLKIKIDDGISCIQETGVANFMRCNIWHVKGRDFDLIIDTGMGINPLKEIHEILWAAPSSAVTLLRAISPAFDAQ